MTPTKSPACVKTFDVRVGKSERERERMKEKYMVVAAERIGHVDTHVHAHVCAMGDVLGRRECECV